MLRFAQFLIEKFWTTEKTSEGYVEIYKNPTTAELDAIWNESEPEFGDPQLAGIVDGNTLYLWDRENGEHRDVKGVIKRLSKTWLPIYIKYDPQSKVGVVTLSSWSMSVSGRMTYNQKEELALLNPLKKHPGFKGFKRLDVKVY